MQSVLGKITHLLLLLRVHAPEPTQNSARARLHDGLLRVRRDRLLEHARHVARRKERARRAAVERVVVDHEAAAVDELFARREALSTRLTLLKTAQEDINATTM